MTERLTSYRCPVEATLKVIGGKWKPLILWQMRDGPRRFSAIKAGTTGITQKMLTQQLRELEADGMVERQVYMEMPLRVEYNLSERGKTFFPVLQAMAKWGFEQNPQAFDPPLSVQPDQQANALFCPDPS